MSRLLLISNNLNEEPIRKPLVDFATPPLVPLEGD